MTKVAKFRHHSRGANNHIYISEDSTTVLRQRHIFVLPDPNESLKYDGHEAENAARTFYLLSTMNTEKLNLQLVSAVEARQMNTSGQFFKAALTDCSTGDILQMPYISHADEHLPLLYMMRACLMAFDRHRAFVFDLHIKGNAVLADDGRLYILDPNASFSLPRRGRCTSIGSRSIVSMPFTYQSGHDDARDIICWLWCLMGRHLFKYLVAYNSFVPLLVLQQEELKRKKFSLPSRSELDDMCSLYQDHRSYKRRTLLLWQLLCEAISQIVNDDYPVFIVFSSELCGLCYEAETSSDDCLVEDLLNATQERQKEMINKNPYLLQYVPDLQLFYMTHKPAYIEYCKFVEQGSFHERSLRQRSSHIHILRRSLRACMRRILLSEEEKNNLFGLTELSKLTALMLYVVIRDTEPSMTWWCFGFSKNQKLCAAVSVINQYTEEDKLIARRKMASISVVLAERYDRIRERCQSESHASYRRIITQARLGRLCASG